MALRKRTNAYWDKRAVEQLREQAEAQRQAMIALLT